MLELHRSAVVSYVPLDGAPRLSAVPDAAFSGVADDGTRYTVYVAGHPMRPQPYTLEVRTEAPLEDPGTLTDPRWSPELTGPRWPRLDELATVVDTCTPKGMAFMLGLQSQGAGTVYPPAPVGGVRVLHLPQVMIGQAPAQERSRLVGAGR